MATLTPLRIQSPCDTELTLDGTDYWIDHTYCRSVPGIHDTKIKMLTSLRPAILLSANLSHAYPGS